VGDAPKILWYDDQDCSAGPVQFGDGEVKYVRADLVDVTGPSRKPMTNEEIYEEFGEWDTDFMKGVISGIRYAEKHHEIGRGMG
jgi:hypothetical protein